MSILACLLFAGLLTQGQAAGLRSRADNVMDVNLKPGLDPYVDMQPFDTALGALVIGGFLPEPQPSPQGPIADHLQGVSEECPVLLSYPEQIDVEAPDPCAGSEGMGKGAWTGLGQGGGELMRWSQYCSLIQPGVSRAPMVEYYLPGGDYFGYSQMALQLTGYTMMLYDCTGRLIFTINEFVYQQRHWEGWKLDTKVWMQYAIKRGSKTIAQTKYLSVEETNIGLFDENNTEIASFMRSEGWDPKSEECTQDGSRRKWTITFNEEAANVFPEGTRRWPVAELVTMIALREPHRVSAGFTMPSVCEVLKTLFFFSILGAVIALCVSTCIACKTYCLTPCKIGLYALELMICPNRRPRK